MPNKRESREERHARLISLIHEEDWQRLKDAIEATRPSYRKRFADTPEKRVRMHVQSRVRRGPVYRLEVWTGSEYEPIGDGGWWPEQLDADIAKLRAAIVDALTEQCENCAGFQGSMEAMGFTRAEETT